VNVERAGRAARLSECGLQNLQGFKGSVRNRNPRFDTLHADPSLTDGSFPVTGAFDAQTVQRVKAFQTAHGLDHDGEVGPKTWRELLGLPHA